MNEDLLISENIELGAESTGGHIAIKDLIARRPAQHLQEKPPNTAGPGVSKSPNRAQVPEREKSESVSSYDGDSYAIKYSQLNLSAAKLANFKTPTFLHLTNMITTLDKFRTEMDGSRVPKYEIAYIEKKRAEREKKRREERRTERRAKQEQIMLAKRESDHFYKQLTMRKPRIAEHSDL